MKTAQITAFDAALKAYLQPILDNFLDLQVWAQISASGEWGADDGVLGPLNRELGVLKANHATSYEMSCPEDAWIPTCSISMILTIKGVEVAFNVILVRSAIIALDFGDEDFLEELQGVDLAREFEKMQTFSAMSRTKAGS
jgi:hypothetical protein